MNFLTAVFSEAFPALETDFGTDGFQLRFGFDNNFNRAPEGGMDEKSHGKKKAGAEWRVQCEPDTQGFHGFMMCICVIRARMEWRLEA